MQSTTGFVENKIPEPAILGHISTLLPQRVAWGWRDTTDDHVTNLSRRMAIDDVDYFGRSHDESLLSEDHTGCKKRFHGLVVHAQ